MWLLFFAPICGLPFFSVDNVPRGTKVFNYKEVQLDYFFFFWLCFWSYGQGIVAKHDTRSVAWYSRVTVVSALMFMCLPVLSWLSVWGQRLPWDGFLDCPPPHFPQSSECGDRSRVSPWLASPSRWKTVFPETKSSSLTVITLLQTPMFSQEEKWLLIVLMIPTHGKLFITCWLKNSGFVFVFWLLDCSRPHTAPLSLLYSSSLRFLDLGSHLLHHFWEVCSHDFLKYFLPFFLEFE